MKKSLFGAALFLAASVGAWAQPANVSSAKISLQAGELADAKRYIDEAAQNPATINDPKMWLYRGEIYMAIGGNPAMASTVANPYKEAVSAFIRVIEIEQPAKKKKYTSDAENNLFGMLGLQIYNAGISAYNRESYDSTIMLLSLMPPILKVDYNRSLASAGILDTVVYELTGYAAYLKKPSKDCDVALENFKKLIEMNYQAKNIYLISEQCYLEKGDTTAAIGVISTAKDRFPGEKSWSEEELRLYLASGRQDELLTKLNSTLQQYPNEANLLFVRGNVYDKYINDLGEQITTINSKITDANSDLIKAKTPQQKTNIKNQVAALKNELKPLEEKEAQYVAMAEADYKKCAEVATNDTIRVQALFNLGGLVLIKSRPLIDKINATQNEIEYKKLQKQLNDEYGRAINYMLEYEKVFPNDRNVLLTLKELYFKTGNKAKSEEYREKAEKAE